MDVSRATSCFAGVVLALGVPLSVLALRQSAHSGFSLPQTPKLFQQANFRLHSQVRETTQEPVKQSSGAPESQPAPSNQLEQLRKTNQQLTAEVERLRKRVRDLERERVVNTTQDRLTKEEQRAEALQAQLLGIAEKETPLQSRMDELTEALRPENIDNLPVAGSLHPEAVREATRRTLTGEKRRIQAQLDLLHQSRTRIQNSLTETDATILRLRTKLTAP
jgi:peptidoglycan hydrolase CwlO-like protein